MGQGTQVADGTAWLATLPDRRLVPFVGAGVSMVPPTCLPGWTRFNQAVLEAVAAVAEPVLGPSGLAIVSRCLAAQAEGRFPPEYVAELIVARFGDGYFEVLRALESDRPNRVHRLLAGLLASGRAPAIVTTSFDTLIEQAAGELGVALKVLVIPEDYAPYASEGAIQALLADRSAAPLLLKLHGTASAPRTCIDTLSQRKQGLAPEVLATMQALVAKTRLLMLGFSGADLEAEPNYLGLRAAAADPATLGFDWLHLPEYPPPPAVQTLVERYGADRARLVAGRLPDWLEPAADLLASDGIHPAREAMQAAALAGRSAEVSQDLDRRARDWAANVVDTIGHRDWPLGSAVAWNAILLSDLARHVGDMSLVREARSLILAHTEREEAGHGSHAAALLLAGDHQAQTGDLNGAIDRYRAAFELYESHGNLDGQGATLIDYSNLLERAGQFEIAEQQYRQAMQLYRDALDTDGYVIATSQLCSALSHRGRSTEALALLRQSAALAADAGNEPARAEALHNLARVLEQLGQPDEAAALLDEADAVHERLGLERRWANGRLERAALLVRTGEVEQAETWLLRAEEVADRIGAWGLLAQARSGRGKLYAETGRVVEAEPVVQEALALRRRNHDANGELVDLGVLFAVWVHQGRYDEVVREGHKAIERAAALGFTGAEQSVVINTAIAHEMSGDVEAALPLYERALALTVTSGDKRSEAEVWGNLGNARFRRQELDLAEQAYARSVAGFEALGDVPGTLRSLANAANVAGARGDTEMAVRLGEQALALARAHQFEGLTSFVQLNLGGAYWRESDFAAAAEAYEAASNCFDEAGDRSQAGYAAFMAAHAAVRMNELQRAMHAVQQALALWEGIEHPQEAAARQLAEQLDSVVSE